MADLKISALTSASTPLAGTEVLPIVQSSTTVKVTVNDMLGTISGTSPAVDTTGNVFLRATDTLGTGVGTQLTMGGKYNASSYYAFGGISSRKENATNNNVAGYTDILTTTSGGALTARMRFNSTGDGTMLNGNLVQGTAGKGINFTANTPAAGMTSELLNWYEEGTFTPVFTNLTVVGTPTYTGTYVRIGRMVYVNIRIQSTTSTSSTAGTTYSNSGFPFVSANIYTTGVGINTGNNDMFATAPIFGLSGGNTILYMPTWSALADVTITGFYFV